MNELKKFFSRKSNIKKLKEKLKEKKEITLSELKKEFLETIKFSSKNSNCAVLFSGGIDSSLIALALKKNKKKVLLINVGLKNSNALKNARNAARKLKLKLIQHEINLNELKESIPLVKKIIKSNDLMQLQIALPEFFALKKAKELNFKEVFVGQGADELFFGYDFFRKKFNENLNALAWKKLENYWQENLKRDFLLAQYFKLNLKAPFLNKKFIEKAMLLPVKEKIQGKEDFIRKHALRKLALMLGLPKEIALKRKKAIQYDTGISKKLKKLIKK
jgi:asparagine synthase (glutamine-hydrolysing)